MRHPGVPQIEKKGHREMNSKMVVVVVGAIPSAMLADYYHQGKGNRLT